MIKEQRPIGVSGLMRVKNEEKFLSLSIDSCISALDELVIVYQESQDRSEEIIKEKQQQYPKKISSFFYKNKICSHCLSDEEFERVSALPFESTELLSTYYNYTLSKCKYKYAMKIDADQIYDSAKLKQICDAYREEKKVDISIIERLVGLGLPFIANINYLINRSLNNTLTFPYIGKFLMGKYENYVIKKIQNDKNPLSLIGYNIYIKNESVFLCRGRYAQGFFPPFNGVFDHLIFEVNDSTFFLPAPIKSKHSKYGNCVIEKFSYDNYLRRKYGWKVILLHGGFLWYHIAPLKSKFPKKNLLLNTNYYESFNDIKELFDNNFIRFWYKQFWNYNGFIYYNKWLSRISSIVNNCNETDYEQFV